MATKESFLGRDIISIDDLSIDDIDLILKTAKDIEKSPEKYKSLMNDRIMAPLFFEPSTRTTTSFQAAMLQLGGRTLDFDVQASSVKKGETLRDTIKIIQGYSPDVIVLRHKKDGSARFAADTAEIPVINAGDGQNQHPTQTLLDLYTIKEIHGSIANLNIAIAGDLKYGRTAHSLSLALSRYPNIKQEFISPETLMMPPDILEKLKEKNCRFGQYSLEDFEKVLKNVDILYVTRVQRERFPEGPEGEHEYKRIKEQYKLTLGMLKEVKESFRIMHPLPKVFEIEEEIDNTKYAYYFKQARNGLFIRKALLLLQTGCLKDG